ncbi:uncharacterized protein F5Z01DRAFT_640047 [Emericellopsis atlantica]|uniref:Uncharacterized protein n=1 Tax=Emericellopsis atlantica TaxID=2614577 RepID=A0A9P7ZFP7_9HYPO|nr:uncharacterized protein F5Z01DRAFT_640047 [Emericellopsis atlantica]KAG9250638.1 hypothetical protein F5Z01DRAFT_640047 [Emericellopsis atlantica]
MDHDNSPHSLLDPNPPEESDSPGLSSGNSPGGDANDEWLLCVPNEAALPTLTPRHIYVTHVPYQGGEQLYIYVRKSKLSGVPQAEQATSDARTRFANFVRGVLELVGDTSGLVIYQDLTLPSLLWQELCFLFNDAADLKTIDERGRPAWRHGYGKVTRSFWRHVLFYAIISSQHDDQLLHVLSLEPDQLRVMLLENICRTSMEVALHAIALLRRLLVESGGQQRPRQLWFPRCSYPSFYVLSELLGTSSALGLCTLETARQFVAKHTERIPVFADLRATSASGEDQFWLRCQDWMGCIGVTCYPSLVWEIIHCLNITNSLQELPDIIGLYITEAQAIEIDKYVGAFPDKHVYEPQFRHLQALLIWYSDQAQNQRCPDLEKHLYMASKGLAAHLGEKLRCRFSKKILIHFCYIQDLGADRLLNSYESSVDALRYFRDLMHGKMPPRHMCSIASIDALIKAQGLKKAGKKPTQADDFYVKYWMLRMEGQDDESAYESCTPRMRPDTSPSSTTP